MSDYSSLKATINANIKANNNHEITGAITNSVLNAMVDSLGAGYQFMGVATPTNPGSAQTPDYKCFYLATTPGTYTNLGGLVVAEGEVAILKYDTAWTKEVTGVATADQVSQLGQELLKDIFFPGSGIVPLTSEGGYHLTPEGDVVQDGSGRTNKYDVSEMSVVAIVGRQGTPTTSYAIACAYDENNTLLRPFVGKAGQNYDNLYLILPQGTKYLKVCSSNTYFQPSVECKSVYGQVDLVYNKFNAISISENADLNDITKFGIYKFSGSVAATLLNIPFIGGGYLIVEKATPNSDTYFRQSLIYGLGKLYYRFKQGTTWTEWINLETRIYNEKERAVNSETFICNNVGFPMLSDIEVLSTETAYLTPTGGTTQGSDAKTNTYNVEGQLFASITGRQGNPTTTYALACVYDGNNTLLHTYLGVVSTNYENYIIPIPANAKYLKVCSSNLNSQPIVSCRIVGNIKELVDSYYIPYYWKSYMDSKIATINQKAYDIGLNGDNFIFITDVHEDYNFGNSPRLMKYIIDNTSVRNIIFGGDTYTSAGSTVVAEQYLQNFRNTVEQSIRLYAIRGNHDTGNSLTKGNFYSIFDRPLENTDAVLNHEVYFYRDNVAQKIRYIFCDVSNLNNAIDATQSAWITSRITELESGWTIVLFAHSYWQAVAIGSTITTTTAGNSLKSIIDAAVDNAQATVAALITGHTHADRDTNSEKGYAIIATTTDGNGTMASTYDPVTPTRTPGTTLEQAFDVFNINTKTRTIYATRIGGNGTDRQFSY